MKAEQLIMAIVVGLASVVAQTALAQRAVVAAGLAEVRSSGDEAALVQLADRIGPGGIESCLTLAGRSGRLVCARAARYLLSPWPVLRVLAPLLADHDRQVASLAADSMGAILSALTPAELGAAEVSAEEGEALLGVLSGLAREAGLSADIRAQIVAIYGAVARLMGAALDVPRTTLASDPDPAVRRAAASVLVGSGEEEDLGALVAALRDDSDLFVRAQAAAGVCAATLALGQDVPRRAARPMRNLLRHRGLRPALGGALLVCLARSPSRSAEDLRRLATAHPHEGTRAFWRELVAAPSAPPR